MAIKFIYFDVGQVMVNFKPGFDDWCTNHHISDNAKVIFNQIWSEYSDRMCVDYDLFENLKLKLKTELDGLVSSQLIDDFDFVKDTVDTWTAVSEMHELIRAATAKYFVGILSNAYIGMIDYGLACNKIVNVPYSNIIDSSKVGLIKPDKRIYELASSQSGFDPREIFFIDDQIKNIVAATDFGWQTYRFDVNQIEPQINELKQILGI